LLPLTSLALLCAYLFKDRMWKRVVLVLSSIPISVLVKVSHRDDRNAGRMVRAGAQKDFTIYSRLGAVMASLGLLILEMLVLASIGSKGIDRPFSLDSPGQTDLMIHSAAPSNLSVSPHSA